MEQEDMMISISNLIATMAAFAYIAFVCTGYVP